MTFTATLRPAPGFVPILPFPPNGRVVNPAASAAKTCEGCVLKGTCLPDGLDGPERQEFMSLIIRHRHLAEGQTLFRAGNAFNQLYIVKTGSLKTALRMPDGREQVTGFHFAGDVLGVDAISGSTHPSEAIALEKTIVCAIPFPLLQRMSQRVEHLQIYIQRLLAREVTRSQGALLLLGRMSADERVVSFLLDVSQRFAARGCSPLEFKLSMAREDIAAYLGLTLETVSRGISRLRKLGVLKVKDRQIHIIKLDALQRMIGSRCPD